MDLSDLEERIAELENQKSDLVKKIQAIDVETVTKHHQGVRSPFADIGGRQWNIEPWTETIERIRITSDLKDQYQEWYTISQTIISNYLPNRLSEFENLYEHKSRKNQYNVKDLLAGGYLIADYRGKLLDLINNQFSILKAVSFHAKFFEKENSEVEHQSGKLQLEQILRSTGKIIEDRNIDPKNETEVKREIHSFLSVVFPDTSKGEISIHKPVKVYKPDIGILNLNTAIEYKFADSLEEVKTCIDGIFEDVSGYAGSEDWKYFYAVIYMTGCYYTQEKIEADFRAAKIGKNWIPILVVGKGKRQKKNPKS